MRRLNKFNLILTSAGILLWVVVAFIVHINSYEWQAIVAGGGGLAAGIGITRLTGRQRTTAD
jgi:hypothetical protein